MHQHRRRKKRPSYGIRTIEIARGKNGFGFTISGQAPCILSCIVSGSPAEGAGLHSGDFLIAVNGLNVSKALHDDVVHLIGNSTGVLKLQIAENYYSDSSDEEFAAPTKPRPKYFNRLRHRQHNSNVYRAERVVRDLQTGALFTDHHHNNRQVIDTNANHQTDGKNTGITPHHVINHESNKALWGVVLQQKLTKTNIQMAARNGLSQESNFGPCKSKNKLNAGIKFDRAPLAKIQSPVPNANVSSLAYEVFHSIFTEKDLNSILYPSLFQRANSDERNELHEPLEHALLRAVVGYLGTIEMPKEPQLASSRLQAIRNCIRRLRVEKKVHTLVLLTVYSDSVLLINLHGLTLAEFPAEKITFSGVYADDKKFFGLVTSHGASSDEFSEGSQEGSVSVGSSCHVFMVDPKLQPHHQHAKRAKAFRICCTPDPVTNRCQEFPDSVEPILQAIVGLYRSRLGLSLDTPPGLAEFDAHVSPQPSNTSSNSSNSDSGIGFRDEGNNSDRVFIVDADNFNRYHTNSLDRQLMSVPNLGLGSSSHHLFPVAAENSMRLADCEGNMQGASSIVSNSGKNTPSSHLDRLTVRAMPDPVGFQHSLSFNTDKTDVQLSTTNLRYSSHKYLQAKQEQSYPTKLSPSCQPANQDNPTSCTFSAGTLSSQNGEQKQYSSNRAEALDIQRYKLSPKVFGLSAPTCKYNSTEPVSASCDLPATVSLGVSSHDVLNEEKKILNIDHSEELITKVDELKLDDEEDEQEGGSQDVHPPTQDEGTNSDSDDSGSWVEPNLEVTKKWARVSSLRQHFGRHHTSHRSTHEAGALSDGDVASSKHSVTSSMLGFDHMSDIASMHGSSCDSERPVDVGRVGSWAAGFDKLLEDPAGLYAFSGFLKKEFSQENIKFWMACEKYRKLTDKEKMAKMARAIYDQHLYIGASEPVNVDSHARQVAQEGLESPTSDLFLPAQKQIFNLMKFDCYQRFLKSQLFKECMMREMQGISLPCLIDQLDTYIPLTNDGGNKHCKERPRSKDKEELEERRRKSLLPWNRSKLKSSDIKHGDDKFVERCARLRKSGKMKRKIRDALLGDDTSSTRSDVSDSRSSLTGSEGGFGFSCRNAVSRESLNSLELACLSGQCAKDGCHLCKVSLPDLSTTIVKSQPGETIGTMLNKLMDRRCLELTVIDVYIADTDKLVDVTTDIATLGCKELRVEERIIFRLDLPGRRHLAVKSKSGALVGDILKPILQKYGYKMDQVVAHLASSDKPLSLSSNVSSINKHWIIILAKDSITENKQGEEMTGLHLWLQKSSILRDLFPVQLFEQLVTGKQQFDELGVIELDGPTGSKVDGRTFPLESHSGLFGFVRRNSLHLERENMTRIRNKTKINFANRASLHEALGLRVQIPFSAQAGNISGCLKSLSHPDSDEMFEVWNRAQRSRLDDQRGTEINFELPDFLKVEGGDQPYGKEKCTGSGGRIEPGRMSEVTISGKWETPKEKRSSSLPFVDIGQHLTLLQSLHALNEFQRGSIIPSGDEAGDYFNTTFCFHSNKVFPKDGRLSPRQAQNLGVLPPPHVDLLPLPSVPHGKVPPQRPSSHPLSCPLTKMRPSTRSLPPCSNDPKPGSKPVSPVHATDSSLLSNIENLSLDVDLDITMKPQSPDSTLTPSKIPAPEIGNTSLHLEKANYPPPSPLESTPKDSTLPSVQPMIRRLPCKPPPLPPKAKTRGPPPRPPSRQLISVNSNFYQVLGDDSAEENVGTRVVYPSKVQALGVKEVAKHRGWARKGLCADSESAAKCSVSFV